MRKSQSDANRSLDQMPKGREDRKPGEAVAKTGRDTSKFEKVEDRLSSHSLGEG